MALNLGDIRFGLTADTSALTRAQAVLRNFAESVNSVVTKTDQMSTALQSAAAKQEKAIRSSLSAFKDFQAAALKAGAPSDMIRQSELDFKRLAGVMQSGQLNALDYARAIDRFNISMASSEAQLKAFTDAQKVAAKAEAGLVAETNAASAGVDRIRLAIGGAEGAAVRMASAQLALNKAVELGIIDTEEASVLYKSYATKVTEATESQKGFLGILMSIRSELAGLRSIAFTMNSLVASFFFLTQGLQATVGAAAEFDYSMGRIQSLTNASSDDVKRWSAQILELAPKLGVGPKELGDALYYVASSGVPVSQAMNIVTASAQASVAGLGEIKDIANLVTSVMNVYGASNISAAQATNILIAAVREGKTAPEEFARGIGQVLSIAGALKVPFDQVAASIAVFTRQGLSAEQSATLLQNLLRAFLNPSTTAQKALSNLTYQGQQLSSQWILTQIQTKGLIATLQELNTATNGNDAALAQIIGSSRSLRGALGLLVQQGSEATTVFNDVHNAGDSLGNAMNIQMQQPLVHFHQALSALKVELINVSNAAIPIFVAAADFFTAHVQGIFTDIGALGSLILGWFAGKVLVSLVQSLYSATTAFTTFIQSVAEAQSFTAAFGAEGLAISLGSIGTALTTMIPVLTAVIGLVVALGYAFKSATDQTSSDLHTRIANLIGATNGGPQAALQQALQDNQTLIDNLSSQIDSLQSRIGREQSYTAIPGRAGQELATAHAQGMQNDIDQLHKLQSEFKQATSDAGGLIDAMKKINASMSSPAATSVTGGAEGGNNAGTPITTINGAINAYKQLEQAIIDKTKANRDADNTIQDSLTLQARDTAMQTANDLAIKMSNGDHQKQADILKALQPLINSFADAQRDYLQEVQNSKASSALDKILYSYQRLKLASDQVTAGQEAYVNAVNKLKDMGVTDLTQFKDKLDEIRAAAEKAFAFNEYERIVSSAVSGMRSDISNFLQNIGSSNALQSFVTSLRNTFEKTIADGISEQIMLSLGSELNGLFTGLGTLLGFTAPTDMTTAIATATTTGASAMATAIVAAGNIAAASMASAIAAAGAANAGASALASGATAVATTASHGAAFVGGIKKFAAGGVVSTSTLFNYTGGVGMMGEAGAEGILPLSRGPDGNLGVKAQGVAGDSIELHVHYNIDASGSSPQTIMHVKNMIDQNSQKVKADIMTMLRRKQVPRV